MKVKYLYIDDDLIAIKPLSEAIESQSDDLCIECIEPKSELSCIIETIEKIKPDGLILDWKIDDTPNEDGERPNYKASTLAQEIRSKSSQENTASYPIVVFSSLINLKQSYSRDSVSHDLFDLVLKKEDVVKKSKKMAHQLVSIVNGYKTIDGYCHKTGRKPVDLFNLNPEYGFLLDDERFIEELPTDPLQPVYHYAKFILDQIIQPPGILIDDLCLSARLGVDIEKSADWYKLVSQYLSEFLYKGPFHEGWSRWWSKLVEKWWLSFPEHPDYLQNVPANERVKIIIKSTGLEQLVPALPDDNDSSCFWAACQATGKPLDPPDGFIIKSAIRYPWQERLYISKKAARERIGFSDGISIDPIDIDRYLEYLESTERKG